MLIIKPYIIFKNKGRERDSEFLEMQDFDHRLEAQSKQKYRKFHEEDDFKVHQNKEECKYEEDIRDVKLKKAGGIQIQQKGDILKEMLYNSVHQSSHDESHSMSEIVVHQFIETIEYVLGTVSNTASYLRLWALSLAHSQLSAVFFEKLLEPWIKSGNGIALFFAFPIFASITLGVLMCMDSME